MNSTTKRTIEMATALGRCGFAVPGIEVHTPDGRTWAIDTTGPCGFRLFEIDPDGRRGPDEHDAVDGDTSTRWANPKTRPDGAARAARPARPPEAREMRASLFAGDATHPKSPTRREVPV